LHPQEVGGEGDPGELLGEPGLADAGLADAENEATRSMAGVVEPRPQPLELAPSSDDASPVTRSSMSRGTRFWMWHVSLLG
jgi:hypothetical protein